LKKLVSNVVFQSVLVGLLGVLSTFIMVYAYVMQLTAAGVEVAMDLVISDSLKMFIEAFLLSFAAWLVGVKLAPKLDLNVGVKIEKDKLLISLTVGFVLAAVIVMCDKFVFESAMGVPLVYDKGILTNVYLLLYSGVLEEVIYRVGCITVIGFAIHYSILNKKNDKKTLSVIISSSLVILGFFLMNFIPVQEIYYPTLPVILKSVLFYVVPSVAFSAIYIKKGLVYSIISHVTMIVTMNFILIPLLA